MTGQPPPDPRPSRRDLGFDELIAIFVALTSIGTLLWWGLTRNDELSLTDLNLVPNLTSPTPQGSQSPSPAAGSSLITPSPRVSPAPTVIPGANPAPAMIPPVVGVVPPPTRVTPAAPSPTPEADVVVVPAPTEPAIEFSDLPATYWAYPFIADLSRRGIVSGFEDKTFRPDQPVTRAEYAALIKTILPPDQRQQPISFKDVATDYWATPAIDDAVKAGFLKGYPTGDFQPEQPISRVQVLASLVNGIQLSPGQNPAVIDQFQDRNQIPNWAIPSTATATQAGVVVNYPNKATLNPNQPATRAEVAAMIYQALEATGQVPAIASEYIVEP